MQTAVKINRKYLLYTADIYITMPYNDFLDSAFRLKRLRKKIVFQKKSLFRVASSGEAKTSTIENNSESVICRYVGMHNDSKCQSIAARKKKKNSNCERSESTCTRERARLPSRPYRIRNRLCDYITASSRHHEDTIKLFYGDVAKCVPSFTSIAAGSDARNEPRSRLSPRRLTFPSDWPESKSSIFRVYSSFSRLSHGD